MGSLGANFAVICASVLVACSFAWCLLGRHAPGRLLARAGGTTSRLPVIFWAGLAIAGFVLPVVVLWASAQSLGNALAGYFPWADATEYYSCSQDHLLGVTQPQCVKRPFYAAFLASLLLLTGNKFQLALLLQAAMLGLAAFLFVRELARDLYGPAALSAYAVLFLFAATFCGGTSMTENAGFLLGILGLALLWRGADTASAPLMFFGIVFFAAAQNARPGAMFVLPAIIGWLVLHAEGGYRRRLALTAAALAAMAIGIAVTAAPPHIAGNAAGEAHSNFSYSLYGLAAGGKGWLHVTVERPELFSSEIEGIHVTERVYQAAIESILNRPHLFALGYIKGIGLYFERVFRYAHDFKLLEYAGFYLPWLIGIYAAIRRWRDPRYALLLWLLAGVIASSPFVIYDVGNRVLAGTIGLDALLVALGLTQISLWRGAIAAPATERPPAPLSRHPVLPFGAACLLVPIAAMVFLHSGPAAQAYAPPDCPEDTVATVVRPGGSALVLPLVLPGEESIYPLRVRADHFVRRMHKSVFNQSELKRDAGVNLVAGIRLEQGNFGELIRFVWPGRISFGNEATGFCVREPKHGPGGILGTAVEIRAISATE